MRACTINSSHSNVAQGSSDRVPNHARAHTTQVLEVMDTVCVLNPQGYHVFHAPPKTAAAFARSLLGGQFDSSRNPAESLITAAAKTDPQAGATPWRGDAESGGDVGRADFGVSAIAAGLGENCGIQEFSPRPSAKATVGKADASLPFFFQFAMLCWRGARQVRRDPSLLVLQVRSTQFTPHSVLLAAACFADC